MMLNIKLSVLIYFILFPISVIGQTIGSDNSTLLSQDHGLIFEKESHKLLADSSYISTIQLTKLSGEAHGMQFRLLFNKDAEDSTILIFKEIQKGADLSDPSWLLDFNVIKGEILKNGASQDEVFIVVYNLDQGGGLLPGEYNNLFTVKYKIASLADSEKNIKSSIKIAHAQASTFDGFAIDIAPSRDELKITVKRK